MREDQAGAHPSVHFHRRDRRGRREFRRTADPMRKLATTPMAASRGTRLPSVNRHVKLRPTGDWAPQRLGAAGAEWPPQARVPA
jgi:hypothetical protein